MITKSKTELIKEYENILNELDNYFYPNIEIEIE